LIIHTYLTDGMLNWGPVFLDSYKKHNGENVPIIISTRDLKNKQIKRLYNHYSNLEIRNKNIDYNYLSKRMGLPTSQIKQYKKEIEHGNVNKNNKIWKQYISVEDRYRDSIVDVMDDYIGTEHSHMMHIDIDMYFRDSLQELFEIIENNDISIKFRIKEKKKKFQNDNRKVLGSIIGFKLDERVREFMEVWRKHIDNLHLTEKKKGYGQASFYYAYLDTKDKYKWGQIGKHYATPNQQKNAIIWAGNRGEKDKNLNIFKEDSQNG